MKIKFETYTQDIDELNSLHMQISIRAYISKKFIIDKMCSE